MLHVLNNKGDLLHVLNNLGDLFYVLNNLGELLHVLNNIGDLLHVLNNLGDLLGVLNNLVTKIDYIIINTILSVKKSRTYFPIRNNQYNLYVRVKVTICQSFRLKD